MNTINDIKPSITSIEKTEKLLNDQGYSFDEAGQSFDEAGVDFGGVYGPEGDSPTIDRIDNDIRPKIYSIK
jgi:hypothetical protein